MKLRPYQEQAVINISKKIAEGNRKVIFQLATGGGKAITLCAISQKYSLKSGKSVLILVHRKELLKQTRRTLYNAFGIDCQIIIAGMRNIQPSKVYVGMVESVRTRVKKIPTEVGMVIIDEAHIANFNKLHDYFPHQYIIGFTATPLSSSKKNPLKNHYDDIVCGVDIPELIEGKHLCQNITYAPKDSVDRAELVIKNGEFDEGKMGKAFSKPKHINNTVLAYEKYAKGTKALIFNCTIDHSIQVNNAFLLAGYESRHLDSTMLGTERDNILRWFDTTPGAILNNVGIATTGTDIPSIQTIIMNKATLSMPHWLQTTGRGSRPFPNKDIFTIIDMGGNAIVHNDWNCSRDWNDIFHNPPKKSDKEGVAPIKCCPKCDAIIAASARVCDQCGFVYPPPEEKPEGMLSQFVVITKGIDVANLIEQTKDKKPYFAFFEISRQLAESAKMSIPKMTEENAAFILNKCNEKCKEWCKRNDKKYNQWHQQRAKEALWKELMKCFKKWKPEWTPPDEYKPTPIAAIPGLEPIKTF